MAANVKVKRKLKTRHISMMAIGGAIGTGLFMSSGLAISQAGPGGAILAYILIGAMVYFLMTGVGEMATYLPVSGSFATYANRFVDPAFGFAIGWNYWLNGIITIAVDVATASLVMRYWFPNIPLILWGIIFFVIIFTLNALSVKFYGESEYWFALIKVVTIIVFLIVGFLTIFGILGGEFIGTKNFTVGDAPFNGGFLAFLGIFLIAGFSFQGSESVGVMAGESENPQKSIPKAIKQVFWRILLFYILTILVISLIIPYTSPELMGGSDVTTSPFTLVFERAGLAFVASIMNAVILTSILSSGSSVLFASSRMLFAMGHDGAAGKIFRRTNRFGIPFVALLLCFVATVGIYSLSFLSPQAYLWLINASGLTGFIAWAGIAISHFRFRRAFAKQNIDSSLLKYKAPWFPIGSMLALVLCICVIIGQNYDSIINFQLDQMLVSYAALPVFALLYFAYKLKNKSRLIPLKDVDLTQNTDYQSED
ncbi:amino acid permease [Brochothrix campestris]|uniref:Lysine-specific permease n=1 Tax=Brochothrix campestris FSL F6-1037 TaxID=1265861 RepID=W7D9I9_9LIST|nr:amino acid permease [Brochothrix campestris]EUJ41918.1 lysine-specific permease [Brochothrix campestris FSL F6-1037]